VPVPILLDVARLRAKELAAGSLKMDRRPGLHSHEGLGGWLKGLARKELWSELALEDNPVGRKILFDQAEKQVLKRTNGFYPAPLKALEAARVGLEQGVEDGLKLESKAFGELMVSNVSRRLVEIFFATTELKKENGTSNASQKPLAVKKIGILGGGLMGGGI